MDESKIGFKESYLLVGQFMQMWSMMEAALDDAVAAAVGLTPLQQSIVCSNIQLRDKIHITRTATNIFLPKLKREAHDKMLKGVADFANANRNMVVHNMFGPNDDETAVEFLITKAKGTLKFPKAHWTREDFLERFRSIANFTEDLKELRGDLKSHHDQSELARALAAPNAKPEGPGLLGLLSPLPQDDPDSHPATPQTNDKNHPSAEE